MKCLQYSISYGGGKDLSVYNLFQKANYPIGPIRKILGISYF